MAKHLSISGIVQGVGYRASFQMQAQALKLSGWVRNRRDGSVEAAVAGNASAVEKIVAWARRGPPGSQVDHVAVDDLADEQVANGRFDVLPTV